jgi:hypothetical protein
VIRFSASLVVVGIGLLVAGSVTSRLPLIYIAIGVSAVALLFLLIGAIVNRAELLGREPESVAGDQTDREEHAEELDAAPAPATTAVGASAGASANSGPGYTRERAEDPGYGPALTSPDRPREAAFTDQPAYRDTGATERRRPSQPQQRPERSFNDPEPTRMDLSAADIRAAGRQERERAGRSQPGRNQPERPADQPFVDPNPTRMDWAGGLREAERQERARQDQERRNRERSDRDQLGGDRTDQPFVDPNPTRMDWAADFREHGQSDQPGVTPAPTQATPVRPDKLLVGRPDSKTPSERRERTEEPEGLSQEPREPQEPEKPLVAAEVQAPTGKPGSDRPGDNEAGDTKRPAEQPSVGQSGTDRPAQAAVTQEQEAQVPTTDDPPAGPATAKDSQDSAGLDSAGQDRAGLDSASPNEAGQDGAGSKPEPALTAATDQNVTVVPGVPRFHRSDCILIRFMSDSDLQRMPVERAKESGCTPCRACQPEGDEDA